jgi:hypothetical protein
MVLVAVALLALIGSVALILLAGSAEWQKNQLQELADSAALASALKIGDGCDAAKARTVIAVADTLLAARRPGAAGLAVANGTCATPSVGTDTFGGGLSAKINYPYRAHQEQVEVILTLTLPISFGAEVGSTGTTVVRRAVAQALQGSVPAVSATDLTCAAGQVNVAGSVRVQKSITVAGSCALYSHARLDASGAYSDLGSTSVYADAQSCCGVGTTWVGAGGSCAAASYTLSSKAICADGFEAAGHGTLTCGTTGTSAYLSAGVVAVNPNPCAALVAPQPVASVPTALPPEPNQDPKAIATLLGTGGAACSAVGNYTTPIVVSGVTVGTGAPLTPPPSQDPSGFYHFSPSCYGYLNPAALAGVGGSVAKVQAGPEVGPSTKTLTATLPAPGSAAGTLLVVTISSDTSVSNKPFTLGAANPNPPSGWVSANNAYLNGAAHTQIWYWPNNPGSITSAVFDFGPASIDAVAQMTEWSGVATVLPLDTSGSQTVSPQQKTATISTSPGTSVANDLVITDIGFASQSAGNAYTPAAGWNTLTNDPTNGFGSEYRLDLPAAVASETVKYSSDTSWAMVIAAFKPAPAVNPGAVLDAGFYYFNGSGICLSGGTLLAKDVTLEFVGTAGFSSGTCAGANCAAPCQFGSDPANAGLDSPNNLTWFAAPCTVVPATGGASCISGWCPAGDRSCSNQLIWAAAGGTGQINLKGNSSKAWLLGTISWPGSCTIQLNGTGTIAGAIACGTLSLQATGSPGLAAIGGNSGINTALVEAVLIE